jgi:hypothetical protein
MLQLPLLFEGDDWYTLGFKKRTNKGCYENSALQLAPCKNN